MQKEPSIRGNDSCEVCGSRFLLGVPMFDTEGGRLKMTIECLACGHSEQVNRVFNKRKDD